MSPESGDAFPSYHPLGCAYVSRVFWGFPDERAAAAPSDRPDAGQARGLHVPPILGLPFPVLRQMAKCMGIPVCAAYRAWEAACRGEFGLLRNQFGVTATRMDAAVDEICRKFCGVEA